MYKIATILGTRPEIIKMSCLINKLDNYFIQKIIFTGQNYDYRLSKIFFDEMGIRKPDFFLNAKSNDVNQSIAKIIEKSGEVIKKIKPDALLVYGDTNSCLSAISAKKFKVPIFHMEAGNRCFDDRVPEEINRRIIDHISDVNIVLSEQARSNLLKEGIKPDYIFNFGSHMFEILNKYKEQINKSNILRKLKLKKSEYFIVSLHREENVDDDKKLKKIIKLILSLKKKYNKKKIIFSTHPRTKKRLKNFYISTNNIVFMKPFGFFDYIKLQKNCFCCISDSGTIFEESSILKFPAISIRDAHERPEGIDSGSVIVENDNAKDLNSTVKIATNNLDETAITKNYTNLNVSSRIVKIIQGYINNVNSKTWYKN